MARLLRRRRLRPTRSSTPLGLAVGASPVAPRERRHLRCGRADRGRTGLGIGVDAALRTARARGASDALDGGAWPGVARGATGAALTAVAGLSHPTAQRARGAVRRGSARGERKE